MSKIRELEPKTLQVEGTMNNNTISKRTIIIFISAFLVTVGGISYEITGFCSQMAQRLAENEKLMTDLSNKNVKLSLYIEDLKNILRQKDEYIQENRKQLTELLNKIEKLTLHTQYLENTIKQKDEYMEQREVEYRKLI
uniref:uncharacterized protein LOC120326364 n=1 Tax=Styela clava TaxID=7725 RepID=UPI00193A0789|nr:uncharacterized protein LOC120326364 [Styela clava]